MIQVLPLHKRVTHFITQHRIEKRFFKALILLQTNMYHPSLNTEKLEPKEKHMYSFRIDRKFRAVFSYKDTQTIEILFVTNHYQ